MSYWIQVSQNSQGATNRLYWNLYVKYGLQKSYLWPETPPDWGLVNRFIWSSTTCEQEVLWSNLSHAKSSSSSSTHQTETTVVFTNAAVCQSMVLQLACSWSLRDISFGHQAAHLSVWGGHAALEQLFTGQCSRDTLMPIVPIFLLLMRWDFILLCLVRSLNRMTWSALP